MRVLLPIIILVVLVIITTYLARWNSQRAIKAERRARELEESNILLAHEHIEREEKERLRRN